MWFKKPENAPPILREDFSRLEPEEFPEKIKQLEDMAQNHDSMTVRTQAYYYAAIAYMHYNNPAPDYTRSLENWDEYIARDTENDALDEVVAWKSILLGLGRRIEELRTLNQSLTQMKEQYERADKDREQSLQKIEDLSQTIERQQKEILSLEDKIKKLDALHAEIEKKKKKK